MVARDFTKLPLAPTTKPFHGAGSVLSAWLQESSSPRTVASPPLAKDSTWLKSSQPGVPARSVWKAKSRIFLWNSAADSTPSRPSLCSRPRSRLRARSGLSSGLPMVASSPSTVTPGLSWPKAGRTTACVSAARSTRPSLSFWRSSTAGSQWRERVSWCTALSTPSFHAVPSAVKRTRSWRTPTSHCVPPRSSVACR